MKRYFWNTLTTEWQQLLYINYFFETKIDDNQDGRYNFWKTPNENYINLVGEIDDKSLFVEQSSINTLQKIDIYGTGVVDLSPIKLIPNLKEFYCGSTNISVLNSLIGNTNLERLCCYDTQISDISPLSGLLNLKRVCLSASNISDITPLKSLKKIEKLSIYKTNVSDLSPLSEHLNLIKLNINYTPVYDLKPLYKLYNLKELHCFQTKSSDSEIQQLKINMPNCKVVDEYEISQKDYDDFE